MVKAIRCVAREHLFGIVDGGLRPDCRSPSADSWGRIVIRRAVTMLDRFRMMVSVSCYTACHGPTNSCVERGQSRYRVFGSGRRERTLRVYAVLWLVGT